MQFVLVVGAVITVVFGFLWVRDLLASGHEQPAVHAEEAAVEEASEVPTYDRNVFFLSAATIGVGAAIGAVVTLPVLGFAVLPAFESHDLPEIDRAAGQLPRGAIRDRQLPGEPPAGGRLPPHRVRPQQRPTSGGVPSFTILFSRCVHLGCPVQANGPFAGDPCRTTRRISLR